MHQIWKNVFLLTQTFNILSKADANADTQDSLLVKCQNDNHSQGHWRRRRGECYSSTCTFIQAS